MPPKGTMRYNSKKKMVQCQKYLMNLEIIKEKEINQTHLNEYTRLIQRKRRIWKVHNNVFKHKKKHMHV